MIYPESFEQKSGFDKIRLLLKQLCLSQAGAALVDEMHYLTNLQAINEAMAKTMEMTLLVPEGSDFPTNHYFDIRPYLHVLHTDGAHLGVNELFEMKRALDTIEQIVRYISAQDSTQCPLMHAVAHQVQFPSDIVRYLNGILNKFGEIKDTASAALYDIRQEKSRTAASISNLLSSIIHKAQTDGYLEKDVTPTLREGRLVIPISPAFKRKLGGIVHDESASGKTVFVEPAQVVEANNRIRSLEAEENREILRILQDCTRFLSPYENNLYACFSFLANIDFLRATALLSIKLKACQPQLEAQSALDWQHARHPLLFFSLQEQKKDIVPLDIRLDNQQRILLISGPNAGGKSVCLKTVALLQYMGQCGLPLPMDGQSRFGLFEHLFIDIGDEQSIENDLSTYSSHLRNMKHFLKYGQSSTLLLIDEFGTGTEPIIGGAIAEAELEVFNKNGCWGVITTHYTNLKHLASNLPGLVNGAMLYDRHRMEPLFTLDIGNPGSSFAIEIARKTGLPESIIAAASAKVGQEHINYDKDLQDIVRDKRYWENKREQIRIKEKKMEETRLALQSELDQINHQRKEIIHQAKAEARELLQQTNATIENTIREIKEAKAEKEKTKSIRKAFEASRDQLKESSTTNDTPARPTTPSPTTGPENGGLQIGDYVEYHGTTAQVTGFDKKKCLLRVGLMQASAPIEGLRKINRKQVKEIERKNEYNFISAETAQEIRERKLRFRGDIDIRGQRAEEAMQTVMYFIDDAILVGVSSVRILHGTGTGALRQSIRQYLSTVSGVKNFHDEHVQLGGAGITVVELY